jgi:two-component system, sensor histidine kinase PdtaS
VLQNAVEHGYAGAQAGPPTATGGIVVSARQSLGRLRVTVDDDGRGLPVDFDAETSSSLGLSIVRTLVESELGGRLVVGAGPRDRGTRVAVDVPLARGGGG